MCGILGAQWKHARPTAAERAQRAVILTVLAHEMDNRGEQSHGIYVPESDALHRRLGSIRQTPMHLYSEARSLFGHTRFATQGKVVEKNAHPFDIDGVIGCHNGTLSNHNELNREYGRGFSVDSQHIFKHIADNRPLSEIMGYGTVVYTHRRTPNEILMARCNGGELTVYTTELGLVWASTEKAVKAALQAAGVVGGKPMLIEQGNLYVATGAELFLRREDFLNFSGSNWRSWDSFGSEDDDARYERWMSSRSVYRGGKWSDDETRNTAYARAIDRTRIRAIADRHGLSRNECARVWSSDFNPLDSDDELYNCDGVFNDSLYWEVLQVVSQDAWPSVDGTDETDPLADIVTTEQGVFKITKDGRPEMLHDNRSTALTKRDTSEAHTTDTVSLPATLPKELAGEEEG